MSCNPSIRVGCLADIIVRSRALPTLFASFNEDLVEFLDGKIRSFSFTHNRLKLSLVSAFAVCFGSD